VRIHYEGRLIDGGIFDRSWTEGSPAEFPLSRLIKAWQEGVPMMHVGETWEFAAPPDLAYGDRAFRIDEPDRTSIPADSALIFRIQLVGLGDACRR
jgi:FKBP-type peptidyl-prolyl cis-trans isomerase